MPVLAGRFPFASLVSESHIGRPNDKEFKSSKRTREVNERKKKKKKKKKNNDPCKRMDARNFSWLEALSLVLFLNYFTAPTPRLGLIRGDTGGVLIDKCTFCNVMLFGVTKIR